MGVLDSLKNAASSVMSKLGDFQKFDFKSVISQASTALHSSGLLEKFKPVFQQFGQAVNEINPMAPNLHDIMIDIGGVQFSRFHGDQVDYYEMYNYIDLDFPIRIVSIKSTHMKIQSVQRLKGSSIEGIKNALDVNINARPVMVEHFQVNPIQHGEYVGILQDTDHGIHTKTLLDERTDFNVSEKSNTHTEFKIALYKASELHYQASANINYNLISAKPSQIIQQAFKDTFPSFKLCMSKLDHDPNLNQFIIPNTTFLDLVKNLDREVNMYQTNFYTTVDNGIFYLLNRDSDPKVDNPELATNFYIEVATPGGQQVFPRIIAKLSEKDFMAVVSRSDMKISVNPGSSFQTNKVYILPSGKKVGQSFPMARKQEIIRKVSEALPGKKLDNLSYETLEVSIWGAPIHTITPLTNIVLRDSNGNPRVYRCIGKEITISSNNVTVTVIRGERIADNE